MPMMTRIMRDGEAIKMPHGWSWWHVQCIDEVAYWEGTDLHNKGEHTVVNHYTFVSGDNSEVLLIVPGDVLQMWRQ